MAGLIEPKDKLFFSKFIRIRKKHVSWTVVSRRGRQVKRNASKKF